jgi:hypothetical protein
MYAGSKRPTDVESPMCATVVQLVVVGACCTTVVLVELVELVVLVVLVELVVVEVVIAVSAGGAGVTAGERVVVVVAVAAAGIATARDGDVTADTTSSPFASIPALQPAAHSAEMTANASGATRRGRVTSRV